MFRHGLLRAGLSQGYAASEVPSPNNPRPFDRICSNSGANSEACFHVRNMDFYAAKLDGKFNLEKWSGLGAMQTMTLLYSD
jgi:hypothetical protein